MYRYSWLDGGAIPGLDDLFLGGVDGQHHQHRHRAQPRLHAGVGVGGSAGPRATMVWTCGQNSYGELCGPDSVSRRVPGVVQQVGGAGVVGVAAGNEHTVMLTSRGEVLTVGYNENGQCGHGGGAQGELQCALHVMRGLCDVPVTQVHAYNGCEHTLMVTRTGELWAVGYNSRGQLGVGDTAPRFRPVKVMGGGVDGAGAAASASGGPANGGSPTSGAVPGVVVTTATCSYYHTVVVGDAGRRLFAFGRNDFGQLGVGDAVDRSTPCELALATVLDELEAEADEVAGSGGSYPQVRLAGIFAFLTL